MLLDKLFLSTSPIASSRVCWGVYNCLEYYMMKIRKCFSLFSMRAKPCLVGLAAEIHKTAKLSKL